MKAPFRILAAMATSLTVLTAALSPAEAAEVGGMKIDDGAKTGGKSLVHNGVDLHTRAMFKVYGTGL
jgi:hypothetical protein